MHIDVYKQLRDGKQDARWVAGGADGAEKPESEGPACAELCRRASVKDAYMSMYMSDCQNYCTFLGP